MSARNCPGFLVVAQFEYRIRRHPEGPRFLQRAEGSSEPTKRGRGSPTLRLTSGYARDDVRS